jgi:hypothetical protein
MTTLKEILAAGLIYGGHIKRILGITYLFFNPDTRKWCMFKNKRYDKKRKDYLFDNAGLNELTRDETEIVKNVCRAKELEWGNN